MKTRTLKLAFYRIDKTNVKSIVEKMENKKVKEIIDEIGKNFKGVKNG